VNYLSKSDPTPAPRRARDGKEILAYAVAVVLAIIGYSLGGHGEGMWYDPAPWYWSAVFIGAAWILLVAAVVTVIGLASAWAAEYINIKENHHG
jgi:hypothetical protein